LRVSAQEEGIVDRLEVASCGQEGEPCGVALGWSCRLLDLLCLQAREQFERVTHKRLLTMKIGKNTVHGPVLSFRVMQLLSSIANGVQMKVTYS
jgi:hypothetical protein